MFEINKIIFISHLDDVFIYRAHTSLQKLKLTQNWLLHFGVKYLIGSIQRHLAAISAGNRLRGRSVDKIGNFEK